MNVKVEIKYKEGYKLFYVKWNKLEIRVVPKNSDYSLLEFLALRNEDFNLTLDNGANDKRGIYLERDGLKIRIMGKDWTGSALLTQIVQNE